MTNLPATVQLSTLSQEIGALTEKLAPAPEDTIAKYLLSMRKAGMSLPQGMKPDDLEAVYGYALSEVPAAGLKRAVEKIIKGEYEIERGFIPRPPELAAMSRAEAKTLREDLYRLREREGTLRDLQKKPETVSEDAKARIRSMLGRFRADHRAQKGKAPGAAVHQPMSDEQAEHWRKIQALKDAPEITEEQRAFRRKVAMDIEADGASGTMIAPPAQTAQKEKAA